jgi:hypothetical protein
MTRMNVPWKVPQILLACVLGASLAACGSSSSTTPPPAPGASSAGSGGNSATERTIASDWTAFFSAKTPVSKRISLLQDGSQFASVIRAQAGSGLAATASAKVAKVTLVSPTQAKVAYSILVSGQSALPNQSGVAVLQDGTWKVGVASFCGLLTIENNGSTAQLPAACKTAG